MGAAEQVALLKERIAKLEAAPRQWLSVLRTELSAFDGLLPYGGLPLGHTVELLGEPASGRTSLALKAVGAVQKAHRLCAWVDGPQQLYFPAAAALGVDLASLLVVRPPKAQVFWTAQQLARSGAFCCVVLDLTSMGLRPSLS